MSDRCLVCGAAVDRWAPGVVAPFIASRIWNRRPFAVRVGSCATCGFRFFSRRLDDNEEGRLYDAYRSEAYQAERSRFEPWYTAALNESISKPENFRARRVALRKLLDRILIGRSVATVLDFGGGGGELVHQLIPSTQTFVYDISGSPAVEGAIPLRTLTECREHHFDLIVCSNVLEHVADPRAFLEQIDAVVGPDTLVYVEVPRESPFGLLTLAKRALQQGILFLKRPRIAFQLLGHNFLVQMHEHVNFFGSASLNCLVGSREWQIVASGTYAVDVYQFGFIKLPGTKLVWCLAAASR